MKLNYRIKDRELKKTLQGCIRIHDFHSLGGWNGYLIFADLKEAVWGGCIASTRTTRGMPCPEKNLFLVINIIFVNSILIHKHLYNPPPFPRSYVRPLHLNLEVFLTLLFYMIRPIKKTRGFLTYLFLGFESLQLLPKYPSDQRSFRPGLFLYLVLNFICNVKYWHY